MLNVMIHARMGQDPTDWIVNNYFQVEPIRNPHSTALTVLKCTCYITGAVICKLREKMSQFPNETLMGMCFLVNHIVRA